METGDKTIEPSYTRKDGNNTNPKTPRPMQKLTPFRPQKKIWEKTLAEVLIISSQKFYEDVD